MVTSEELLVEEIEGTRAETAGGQVRFHCSCGQSIKVPDKYVGGSGKCPKCGQRITIPAPSRKA